MKPNEASEAETAGFGTIAKGLSRNPLGIIALFIVLIYGFASLVVGFSGRLDCAERAPIIWFLVLFPVAVLVAFCWLVSRHHEKLYAPKDYSSDDAFLRGVSERADFRRQVIEIENQIEGRVREKLTSPELVSSFDEPSGDTKAKLTQAAEQVTKEIRDASSFVIDARQFTHSGVAWYPLPLAAFPTFGDLTDEVYFRIEAHVAPYEYGNTWILRNRRTNSEVRGARAIVGGAAGVPIKDNRTLSEVGINPGDELEVVRPFAA